MNEAERVAASMVISCPDDRAKRQLARDVEVFGPHVLRLLHEDGVRIAVLTATVPLTHVKVDGKALLAPRARTVDGRSYCDVRACYDGGERLILIGEERLGGMTARHEVAHAFDHVLGRMNGCEWISRPLWRICSRRAGFVSEYARTNSLEYFAESCEAWLGGGLRRDDLRRCDCNLYEWLTTLFARFDVY